MLGDGQVNYTILGMIAKGGFGEVYKARMEAPGGFVKDVAVKLMRDGIDDKDMLRRMRDEVRILAMIQDRTLTGVQPPTQLDGRWAMVMEYVPGRTLAELFERKPLPPGVVAEISAEVLRCLIKCYTYVGPAGEPLHLVHRDLKPGNIMLTPDGDVKLLDFGMAQAVFEHREAMSMSSIGGTAGFIPPERLFGVDGPEGDIFSLGVTMQVLLLGRSARTLANDEKARLALAQIGCPRELIDLTSAMRAHEPELRPTAQQALAICRAVRGDTDLRQWATENVDIAPLVQGDLGGFALSGHSMSLTPHSDAHPPTVTRKVVAVAAGGVGLVGMVLMGLGLVALVLVGTVVWTQKTAVEQGSLPSLPNQQPVATDLFKPRPTILPVPVIPMATENPEPVATTPVDPVPQPEPGVVPVPVSVPVPSDPVETQPPEPVPAPVAPIPRPPPPSPEPEVPTLRITIKCESGGAAVQIDGGRSMSTPLLGVEVNRGTHTITYSGACSGSGSFLFGGRRGCSGVVASGDVLRAVGCR